MVKENRVDNIKTKLDEPIAIIGMNCQFPGIDGDVENVEAFYDLLIAGETPIKEVPKARWDIDTYYDTDRKKADKIITRQGGFLNHPSLFDAVFFKISSTEAKQIDPQHRLFMEVAIRAILHANMPLASLKDSNTGVYCGISTHEYSQLNYKDKIQFNAYTPIGVANSAAAGRLCHFLKLKGPSMAVDTACSSSLSALYLAVTALRAQQCDMAIAGGVHLSLCPESCIGLTKANMLSATGQCRSFDSQADGFARSEGSAVVVVKRLSDAIRDNNTIHAVIKSIVMNQDGDGAGLAAPNVHAQIALHQAVLTEAKMSPSDIDYIETHGTGTPVGDAAEFEAIQAVHEGHHAKAKPLVLGALKSILGHTISSSGIASLIKVISVLKNERIPSNLHYVSPNPRIDPERIPAVFPVQPMSFPQCSSKKRVAQVLNFSFSGTNVSTIIEEYSEGSPKPSFLDSARPHCFVLSANSEASLKQMIISNLQYLRQSSASLRDICYTLINCRDHYKFRCAILAEDTTTLIKKIESGDYEIKKVVINKERHLMDDNASICYEKYLSGENIQFNSKENQYNKVDLPLYCFDRKPYWHTLRETPLPINRNDEPIAIIGMSCRFPKANDLDAFLSLLQRGDHGMVDIPMERWDNTKYYDEKVGSPGRLYIKQLGLIDDIKHFDAEFFDISPREAKLLSPNLRIFLETCYHAIEHANLPLESVKGSNTGVFVGCERNDYAQLLKNEGMSQEDFDLYLATGNVMSAIPGRIAYVFNFHGPIQTIDTACSSSMTAIHNACLSLNAMDCDMAIAGGINLLLNPDSNITLSKAKMLSPESRCKTFSDDADGYARSEGCGVLVLKRLSRAIEDNDNILALIKSSALNGDGKSDGFTVPNPKAQEMVIRQALNKANLSPEEIDFVEAHGTGTPVADPIEANVLSKIFGESHSEEKPLYISSVKTNIGHCESASGVAGVIKAVLSLQHQILFKHLHFKQLNPEIHLKHIEIPLNHLRCTYPLKYAGINSFGFSGANAHLILQQAPQRQKKIHSSKEWLLMISAKKKTALKSLLSSYQNYLLTTKDDFADICYTAATCRHHFSYRVVIKANSAHEAASIIAQNQYVIHHVSKEKKSSEYPRSLMQLQIAYQENFVVHALNFYQSLDDVFEKVNLPLYEFERTRHWFNFSNHVLPSPACRRRVGDEGILVPQTALTPSPSPTSGRGERLDAPCWLNDYHGKTQGQKFQLCKDMVLESCRKVQEVSGTDLFEEDDGFFDIGFDSLMLTELSYELKDKLEPWVSVTVNIGFDYPSINKLTNYIQKALDIHFVSTPHQPKSSIYSDDDIAIIGMSCSFPNAPDITAFEILLEEGLSGIKDIPIERWDNSKYYSADREALQKAYVSQMGLLEDIKAFDAQFFGISPREAKLMDPQQRLFLECCYHALENANYHPQSLKESLTGVFAGVSTNEYYARLEKLALSDEALSLHSITGNVLNLVSGRVAYTFDFKGPSISFDTACSSSLVAIHYACQSLKNREVDYALAGGVNLLLSPESNIKLCKARALSPDGQCKTFDETADGFVRSEGCGVIFLKRMSDAIRDKDNILAVIKASMVNNDGKSAGLTVPNGASQEEVMKRALKQTALSIHDIDYIEAHGTGTPLGDPIEVHAINRVYGSQRRVDKPLYIGSVKTNIGHLESASGVASVIKTVISLKKQKIFKHLNFSQLNPTIKLGDTRIALQNTDWKNRENKPKNAGINAFGFSGTNAHVILQEYVSEPNQKPARRVKKHLLILSAKTKTVLDRLVIRYQRYLETTQDDFADICFTAATCRAHYAYRLALTAENANQASHLLEIGQFSLSHEKKLTVAMAESVEGDNLLDDYLDGANVDWARYYTTWADEYKKVILPNYAFERSEFWLDEGTRSPLPLVGEGLGVRDFCGTEVPTSSAILQHLYYTEWVKLNDAPLIENQKTLPEFWVISRDRTKAKQLLGHLRYQFIENQNDIENIENKNILFFYEEGLLTSLLHFCRQLFAKNPLRFLLITENAYAINKNDMVNPDQTMASAFWKSFSNEIVLHKNYTIDLGTDCALPSVLESILNESNTENQFAIRDTIYVPRLKKKKLFEQEILLDSEASYLIVGGTGGLAQPLMDYLIRRNAKHIVLISRSACSENHKRFIEHASDQQITIKHYQADASQYQPMEMIMKDIAENAPPLKGVFHLAGVIQDSMIINLTDEAMHRVVQTKKDSALVLHQLTMAIALDFFVLFSSSASVLGGRGQANYAAANGFLDGLAHQRHQQGKPAIVINWGPFHSVGMAANLIQGLQHQGFIPLDLSSINILDALLKSSVIQISPCPMDWERYLKHSPRQHWLSGFIQQTSSVEPLLLRSLQQQSKDDRFKTLCQVLCEITADILALESVEKITARDRLYSLGMDSLLALELRHRIHDKLQCEGLSLSIEYFINDPTIEKIAGVILEELQTNLPSSVFRREESDGEVALCDFQYIFWVLNRLGYSSNVGIQLRLHGQLNKELLSKAFDFVVQHNSVFWLNVHEDSPTQKIQRQGQFQLIEKEKVSEDFTKEFNQNIMRMMPLTEQPLIRVYLYKIQPLLHELHLVIPHIIIDDMSCSIVLNQFKACYQALCLGKTPTLPAEKETYLRYVQQNNAYYEQDITEKIAFWRAYNKGFKKLYFGPQYHLPDAAAQPGNYLLHYTIPDDVMAAFFHWHQAKNRNISSGLIAVCQMIFFKMSHQKKFPVTILHSGREGSQYKPTVGLFAEYKRINIYLNEEDNFLGCINAIETQLLKTAPYQKCALPIKEEGLKGRRKSISDYLTLAFNKRLLTNAFKRSKRHPLLVQYYLSFYSHILMLRNHIRIKYKLNKLLDWKIPLQKPAKLDVLISITPSFFNKKQEEMRFANLDYTYGSHYGCLDRAVGNQTLWIYFTKNQHGAYQLSINGPLTKVCKDQMAADFNHILSKLKRGDEACVLELI